MATLDSKLTKLQVTNTIELLIHRLVNIQDTTGEFLLRLDDGRVIDTKGWAGWEWTHGVGLFGIWRYYEQSQNPTCLQIMRQWFVDRFAEGETTKNINTVAPFWTLAQLHAMTPDPANLARFHDWAEWLMSPHGLPKTEEGGFQHIVYNDVNPGEMWDDTLMMSVLPLAKIGLLLNRPAYVEEAKRQFLVHTKYLADRKTGLWFHGWTFDGRHNFANALWARGNCWVTIAIPEFVEMLQLPPGDALRLYLLETLAAQVRKLEACQHRSGLWHTLIDDPNSYLEASATAGFAYGILKAVRLGYLPARYEGVGQRAITGLLEHIDAQGEVRQVSFGTAMGDNLQYYRDVPLTSMPYGQSLAICALSEFLHRLR